MSDACDLLCLDLQKAEEVRARRMDPDAAHDLADRASALGDPARVLLAVAMRDIDELCVCDLSWIVERSEKVVSHHVRKMRGAGVLRSRRDGRMVMYSLTDDGRRLLDALVPEEVAA